MILYIYVFQLGALETEKERKVGYLTNDKRCLMETCRDWRMRIENVCVNVWRIKNVNDMMKMMMANDDVEYAFDCELEIGKNIMKQWRRANKAYRKRVMMAAYGLEGSCWYSKMALFALAVLQ